MAKGSRVLESETQVSKTVFRHSDPSYHKIWFTEDFQTDVLVLVQKHKLVKFPNTKGDWLKINLYSLGV